MKIRLFISLLFLFIFTVSVSSALAASDVLFPQDWKEWTSVKTPLTKIGALPGCDADVSQLPQIYQDTAATYCAIRSGGPGKVAVLVRPEVVSIYTARTGQYAEGTNMILHLKDLKVLFVSGLKEQTPVYGVFTEGGKDLGAPSGPLAAETCRTCHSGYTAHCISGQCGRILQ